MTYTHTTGLSTMATVEIDYWVEDKEILDFKVYGFLKNGQRVEIPLDMLTLTGIEDEIRTTIEELEYELENE